MVLEQTHIDQIRIAFEKMQSREDLLHLLNDAKLFVYGDKAVPFELKQLTWYANPKLSKKRYSEFKIKKKSGGERSIHAPVRGLKALQKTLSFVLQCVYEPHNAAMGFVRGKSIVDNAKMHEGSKYVYNIDLKDFFPSIDQARVWKCFQLKPFNLNKESTTKLQYIKWEDFKRDYLKTDEPVTFIKGKGRMYSKTAFGTLYMASNFDTTKEKFVLLGGGSLKTKSGKALEGTLWLVNKIPDTNRLDIANMIASLCCTEMEVERGDEVGELKTVKRNVLPQGAPSSPVITNIVCQRLDFILSGVAKRFGLKYSRYADDITFSSMHNVYQNESDFLKELQRIILDQGFRINDKKVRLQKDGHRKEVTGLLVNEKANVQKRYIKQLRMWLYYWERYGNERAYGYFLQQYVQDKGYVKNGNPDMRSVIAGKLDYLKMVKGYENELYLKLKLRLDGLIANTQKPKKENQESLQVELESNQVIVNLEVYNSPQKKEKLIKSINIPKDTLLPSTIIFQNKTDEILEKAEESKQKILFPHNPIYTISFLKKFKIGDGSGFKELVHDVILSDEIIHDILFKVKSHPNFIYHFKKEWLSDVSFLNLLIQKEVIKLINLFENEGIKYFKNSHKHPFNNDSKYTEFAKQFKKKYRYGSGEEYSKLQFDIINIFKDQKVSLYSLSFMPDERKFNIRSNFFTWQPSIENGIKYIIQGIHDHSNIDGESTFNPAEKNILVEAEKIKGKTASFVELRIIDLKSKVKIDSGTLLQFLQGSSPYKSDFRNLCDWIVECDFIDEPSRRLNLLIAPEYSKSSEESDVLTESVGGFKHILRFYDAE